MTEEVIICITGNRAFSKVNGGERGIVMELHNGMFRTAKMRRERRRPRSDGRPVRSGAPCPGPGQENRQYNKIKLHRAPRRGIREEHPPALPAWSAAGTAKAARKIDGDHAGPPH